MQDTFRNRLEISQAYQVLCDFVSAVHVTVKPKGDSSLPSMQLAVDNHGTVFRTNILDQYFDDFSIGRLFLSVQTII